MPTTPKQPTDEEIAKIVETLTKEETAWLMKIDWRSLQSPKWTFQNKKDLEKLGEALFSGKDLKDLDNDILDRIFPHLVKVAQTLGALLKLGMPGRATPTTNTGINASDDRVIPITKNVSATPPIPTPAISSSLSPPSENPADSVLTGSNDKDLP